MADARPQDGRTLLVVDDDVTFRTRLVQAFRGRGFMRTCLLAFAAAAAGVPLLAHVVVVEHVVQMNVEPQGPRLLVRLHLPATLLVDASLPRPSDGELDVSAIKSPLAIVAADIARNLDVLQDDTPLAMPTALVKIGTDRKSIDVELTYTIREGVGAISARLNAFRADPQSVRTSADYLRPSAPPLRVNVSGAPKRVVFDPDLADALLPIAAQGMSALLGAGDHLLFLVCLLLPVRKMREAAGVVAVLVSSQAAAALLVLAWPGWSEEATTAAAMVAASAVVIVAIQTVVRAQLSWIAPVTFAFGALSGVAFGDTFASAAPLAGSHQLGAFLTFVLVVGLGQLWLGAILWATRMWLNERGVSERLIAVLGSVVVAHEALDRLVDRGHAIARSGSFGAEHALVWLIVGWASAIVVAGLIKLLSGSASNHREQTPLTET
jgi:hypothetical protein